MRERGAARRKAALLVLAAVTTALSACGSAAYQFVANDDRDVVLKVPGGWHQLNTKAVLTANNLGAPEGGWVAFYDASARPSAAHVKAALPAEPLMMAISLDVPEQSRAQVTDDLLLDVFEPVSETARQSDQLTRIGSGMPPRTFKQVARQKVSSSTERGVHVVFSYATGSGVEYFDQIAVTDPRRTRVHAVMVRCAAACYRDRKGEIDDAVDSLTVK